MRLWAHALGGPVRPSAMRRSMLCRVLMLLCHDVRSPLLHGGCGSVRLEKRDYFRHKGGRIILSHAAEHRAKDGEKVIGRDRREHQRVSMCPKGEIQVPLWERACEVDSLVVLQSTAKQGQQGYALHDRLQRS